MIDLFIMMIAFSRLHVLNGWILALMMIKAVWEVIKLMVISMKLEREK